jgi:hypothetical protein
VKRALWTALVTALAVATPASAQIPIGTLVGQPPSGYDDGARRDPFVTLVQKRPAPAPGPNAKGRRGLQTIAVADINVRGIVKNGTVMIAILEGPDRQSYMARQQDRLLDAVVKSIDAQGVVFVEQMQGVTTSARLSELRKTLRPAAEVIR